MACTVCGCVCDDLRLTVENGRIVRAEGACPLSEDWLLRQDAWQPPGAEIDGQPADLETALARSAEILSQARWPLIFGLSRSSTDGQRAAVRLADRIGANIDTTASLCHAPSVMAIQEVGESTCTLGEIKNRADLVVFWGADPTRSHPRHPRPMNSFSNLMIASLISASTCPRVFFPRMVYISRLDRPRNAPSVWRPSSFSCRPQAVVAPAGQD